MTRELRSSVDGRALLQCEFSTLHRGDLSLVSQVELWSNNASVFDAFGADIERESSSFANKIGHFSNLYEDWHKTWLPVVSPLSHLLYNNRPSSSQQTQTARQMLDLYLSAARLYLFSHVFRGPAQRESQPPITVSSCAELNKFAKHAIKNALHHIDCVTLMIESDVPFGILPAYLGTTISFAIVFLLRISQAQHEIAAIEQDKIVCLRHVERLCEALQKSTVEHAPYNNAQCQPSFLLPKITNALKTATTGEHGGATSSGATSSGATVMGRQDDASSQQGHRYHNMEPHNSHRSFEASRLDVFDVDVPLDLDFSFLDYQSFDWEGIESLTANNNAADQMGSNDFAKV